MSVDWPIELRGVTESIVATLGPNGRWNLAALGLFAGEPVTSRTWGNTRTRQNFHREGEGYVQFTRNPVEFVEAALGIYERDEPVLPSADAWVRVEVERIDAGEDGGTRWEEWAHVPVEARVERRVVSTTNRGYNATIEATVAASRLDVEAYDAAALEERLAHLESIVERCGGEREREAMARLRELSAWTGRDDRNG